MKKLLWGVALCCSAFALPVRSQTNVLSHPGFEGLADGPMADNGGVNQWGNYNATAGNCVLQSSVVHSGTNALELNVNTGGSQGYSLVYQNTGSTVASNLVVNHTWYYSFFVDTPSTSSGSFTWAFYPSDSLNQDQTGASGTIAASSLTADTWTQVTGSFTTTTYSFSSGATPDLKATFSESGSTATFYIDKVTLTTNVIASAGSTVAAASTDGITVTVDPPVALTNYTAWEWNTNGNFQGWSVANVSGATVSGGSLSGTASGSDPQVMLTGLGTNGPDLDLAFNDFVDVRLQVPAGFSGGVQIYFGATNNYYFTANATTGFNTNRAVTVTNVPTDGAFHVYRVFFGPHPYWRGNLSDVRVDPLGAGATNGEAFALDYVRVGDLSGEVYTPVYGTLIPGPGTNDANGYPVRELDSKHFRFCWDIACTSNSFWTATMPHGTLRNFEEVWKNHIWQMGWPEPSHPVGSNSLTYRGAKHKVDVTCWYGGYFTGGDDKNTPWVNIDPSGLRVDPPTWVPPHEFTHACQESANTNGSQVIDGQFWENNANYGREEWLYHYPWETGESGLDPYYADTSHFWLGHGRDYYLCWPFWVYLDENPDNLAGLGSSYGNYFSVQLWRSAISGENLWTTLARLAPSTAVADLIGYVARRDAVWDCSHRAALTNAYTANGDMELAQRWTYAELRQRPDDLSWWQTPIEFAPQQGGYKLIKLVPQGSGAGRVVSVNFHGLTDSTRGSDWRASLVVESDGGAVRYSSLWNAGTNSVTLATNENTVFLSVAGTPTNFLAESIDETLQPYQSAPSKERFPYEIQVTGATPYESPSASTNGVTMVQVANGGGWRASTAAVDSTAYVGPNARVLGTAQVRGSARILDYATVEGSAVVSNNAVVSGHALVRGTALVRDYAKVRDYGMVIDNSVVAGYARVLQHGEVTGGSTITNWATVKGSASTFNDSATTLPQGWNDAVLDGDFSTSQSCSNGFQFGFEEYNDGPLVWITNRTAPRRLFAAYEFNATNDSLAKDWLGVTDGYLAGSPTWTGADGTRYGFLSFNGTNQYVILDRSVSDLREITVAAWVKWAGSSSNQLVWYFGGGATNCMYLTPSDVSGQLKFSISTGSTSQTLTWSNALPAGQWTHVAVSLSNAVAGRLYVNGTNVATGTVTLTPDQLNTPNVNTTPQQNYLARGATNSLPFFQGAVDSVRIYTGPLTAAEISALQPPTTVAGPGTLYVDMRATNAASSSATLFGTWTNLGSTVGNFTKFGSATFSTNVAGTGVPGVYFGGSSVYYSSANQSVASLTAHGARSLEVWVCNPTAQDEETTVALGDRSGTRTDCAFMYGTGATHADGAATHYGDDVPWGAMGLPVAAAWHHLVYTYDGNVTVKIYADGQLWYTDILGGQLATTTSKPIYLGCQNGLGEKFSGYLNAVRIWGGAMSASQVTANYLFGPWTFSSSLTPSVVFSAIANQTVLAGQVLTVTNSATDPNSPTQAITFSLVSGPAGATIDPLTGQFTWRPAVSQAATTNVITLAAANSSVPAISAMQSFLVTVLPVSAPNLSGVSLANGHAVFQINGAYGPDYSLQVSTNLSDPNWITIFTTNSPALPFTWTNTNLVSAAMEFYRVLLGP
jgi:hypothetical protein